MCFGSEVSDSTRYFTRHSMNRWFLAEVVALVVSENIFSDNSAYSAQEDYIHDNIYITDTAGCIFTDIDYPDTLSDIYYTSLCSLVYLCTHTALPDLILPLLAK